MKSYNILKKGKLYWKITSNIPIKELKKTIAKGFTLKEMKDD